MARVALVSHDVQTVLGGRAGGVGAFVTHFATLLRRQGDEVTIILTRQETFSVEVDKEWRERYRDLGISLIELHNTPPTPDRWSDAWPVRLSEAVAPLLEEYDIAYFQDWANVAFQAVRAKRFRASPGPVLVTVLHGPSAWIRRANRQYPRLPEDLHVEYIERYSAEHSDHVIAPSRYILEWARRQGWRFDHEPQALGLPYAPGARPAASRAGTLRRIVFFGRLEIRKGFAIFTAALRQLGEAWTGVEEVVLLGYEEERGAAAGVRRELEPLGVQVSHLDGLDSIAAQSYLATRAEDSLAVIPSPEENFPYAVIETSLIPGLNMICSSGGGTPEVLGAGAAAQLFDPHPSALAEKLRERLLAPMRPEELAVYDYEAANRRWMDFHREAVARPHRRARRAAATAKVDVCITYFNKGRYFPQLLEALEHQTAPDFGVIAVDDGSTDLEACAVFESMAERYRARGWIFLCQPNAYVDAARNRAAAHSQADYLLFLDADDVPVQHAVERLLEAALLSGDDCLLSGGYLFEGDGPPLDLLARYLPLGPSLVLGLLDPIVFGLPMILIRRSVFEALGGYRELRGVAHEDWELQVRLLLAGYRSDVVPECLLYFRRLADGLANTSEDYPAKQRLVDAYEERLACIGLHGAAWLIHALQRRCRQLEQALLRQPAATPLEKLRSRVRFLLAKHSGDVRSAR